MLNLIKMKAVFENSCLNLISLKLCCYLADLIWCSSLLPQFGNVKAIRLFNLKPNLLSLCVIRSSSNLGVVRSFNSGDTGLLSAASHLSVLTPECFCGEQHVSPSRSSLCVTLKLFRSREGIQLALMED